MVTVAKGKGYVLLRLALDLQIVSVNKGSNLLTSMQTTQLISMASHSTDCIIASLDLI